MTIPPGGAPDIAARMLAQRLTETMGQSFFIENRSGANGNVAAEMTAHAEPDGYTLIMAADSLIAINPHVYASMPIDMLKDLLPVASVASNQFFLSVNPGVPVKTLPKFVEYARKQKPPLAYASGGNGSQHQLGIEMLKQRAGIDLLACAVSRRRAGRHGDGGGRNPGRAGGGVERGTVAGRQASRARDHGKKTVADVSRHADHRGILSGLRFNDLARPVRAADTPEPIVTRLRNAVQSALAEPELVQKLNVTGKLEPLICRTRNSAS